MRFMPAKYKSFSIGSAMADMAMLLLVFFMVSTSIEPEKKHSLEIPSVKTAASAGDSLDLVIESDGSVFLGGDPVSSQDLGMRLEMTEPDRNRTVSIMADRNSDYRVVSSVLARLRENDYLNVVFLGDVNRGKVKND